MDIRRDSPTFLRWHGEVLSGENNRSLLIPEGFAHGFQTLTDDCELLYLHTELYTPEAEGALNAAGHTSWASLGPELLPKCLTVIVRIPSSTMPLRESSFEVPALRSRTRVPFIDLGSAPPSNAYLTEAAITGTGKVVSAACAGLLELLAGAD